MTATDERTPLLATSQPGGNQAAEESSSSVDSRHWLYDFLEAKTPSGQIYEYFIMILIGINVLAFILATLFVEEYNDVDWAKRDGGICGTACDSLWFGNYADNWLEPLNIGSTSCLEILTIAVFSVEYILRLYTCDLEDPKYQGFWGRLRYIPTFFSLVDLASTLPFYVDSFVLRDTDIAGSAFLRMFRLFRMMRVEGRYDTALTMFDDVYAAQKGILGTALFIGFTTWIAVASLYYLVERGNPDMIYCGGSYCDDDSIDKLLCTIDNWGIVDCADAGCPATKDFPEPCYNLFQSIPLASYYTLLNLFGEFPLIDQHSVGGMVVGTITAIFAVAVFALPAGIIGNGFEDEVERRTSSEEEDAPIVENAMRTDGFVADDSTFQGQCYNFLHAQNVAGSLAFDNIVNVLVIGTALTFMLDTIDSVHSLLGSLFDVFEFVAVLVFTAEYILRVYSAKKDPKFQDNLWGYVTSFLPMVDLLSVLPYWIEVFVEGSIWSTGASTSFWGNLVKALRLLRILRFEKYTHAFTSFDDVLSRNLDVLAVTAFTAVLFWIFFSAFLYFSERDNLDPEMAANYNTVPNAMWVTLLNLSGESPLAQYSVWGKIVTGILGLFATGIFGIPIGILGAGFEQVLEEENDDNVAELDAPDDEVASENANLGTSLEQRCYQFVNGLGSDAARRFEVIIYILIFTAVGVGVLQTVQGHEDDLSEVELLTVIVFTGEYLIRLVGVGADPQFAPGNNGLASRVRFIFSFYSVIDLLAIVPYYLTVALPGSMVDEYDEYLRMARIIRLVKLDKYIPSITLIDDVIRLKFNALRVAFFAAATLWVLFASMIYLFEYDDTFNEIDPVPFYGCMDNCTMYDRFQNFFDSMVYTGIHLTGDYPIITYSWPARFVNFFMVIAAVGVVSIPSGLIASGFVDIVQSKAKARRAQDGEAPMPTGAAAGDDWYELAYQSLEGVEPRLSQWGPKVDSWQIAVNEFLNGKLTEDGSTQYTAPAKASRVFIFVVIISNVAAVLAESVPLVDKSVGNEPGNFFDVFEGFSVMVFAAEYIARLFSAPKNREALFSTLVYATTFFGIVDFLSTAPWFVEQIMFWTGTLREGDETARIFRIFRIFRILQLEDFVTAFSKLDNVFRASKNVLKATGLMALIIWVGCGALFFIFEENNPNWRSCDDSVPLTSMDPDVPGCYDFASTAECNAFYPGLCEQKVFTNMPNSLYLTAVFLGGEWGVVDFTWPGRFVCLFLCVVGIGLYAIPIGALFDSFGAILGMGGDDDEDEEGDNEA
eukprot:Nitzschia sp. Nitz4//scaffold118_size93875//13823//17650//NITZ4_004777-RA/size93875-processed-gene-0.54-mRNA-1//-1//CDS//3329533691//1046//frame0